METKPIQPISSLFGHIQLESKKTKSTEYGDLLEYFYNLNIQTKKGRLSRGAVGMYLSPFIRGEVGNRNYSLLYTLKEKCERSDKPSMIFWAYCKKK